MGMQHENYYRGPDHSSVYLFMECYFILRRAVLVAVYSALINQQVQRDIALLILCNGFFVFHLI